MGEFVSPVVGGLLVLTGLVYLVPYAVVVVVMAGREFRHRPAYQLMIAMAAVDMAQVRPISHL